MNRSSNKTLKEEIKACTPFDLHGQLMKARKEITIQRRKNKKKGERQKGKGH